MVAIINKKGIWEKYTSVSRNVFCDHFNGSCYYRLNLRERYVHLSVFFSVIRINGLNWTWLSASSARRLRHINMIKLVFEAINNQTWKQIFSCDAIEIITERHIERICSVALWFGTGLRDRIRVSKLLIETTIGTFVWVHNWRRNQKLLRFWVFEPSI